MEADIKKYCCFKRRSFPSLCASSGYRILEITSAMCFSSMDWMYFPSANSFISIVMGDVEDHRRSVLSSGLR